MQLTQSEIASRQQVIANLQQSLRQLPKTSSFAAQAASLGAAIQLQNSAVPDLNQKATSLQKQISQLQPSLENQQAELSRNVAKADQLKQQLALSQQDLQNQTSLLAVEVARFNGEQSVPMKLLSIDQDGLTVSGGILRGFIAKSTPCLFDRASGQLALYYQGADDQFRAAYYDTLTAKATFSIVSKQSTIACAARSTEAELDNLSVTITGKDSRTCTVTIGGAESIQEVWGNVPRTPEKFAAVLNRAISAPLSVASLAASILPGVTKTLSVKGLSRSLFVGDLLQVGDLIFTVAQDCDRNATTIEVTELETMDQTAEDCSVNLIDYDYSNATSNRLLADLSQGSLLVRMGETKGVGAVENGTFQPEASTSVCRWVGIALGNTLTLSGTELGQLIDSKNQSQLIADRNLSLEAWIKPEATKFRQRIIQQKAGDQSYSLGVEQQSLMSALQLEADDYVELASAETLGLRDRDFTVELWVRYADKPARNKTGNRGILGTDSVVPNQGFHLCIRANKPYFGFYNNDTAGTTVLAPEVWHHLAFRYTKATGEQAIFVNGKLDTAPPNHPAFQGRGIVKLARVCSDDPRSMGGYALEDAVKSMDKYTVYPHSSNYE